MYLRNMGRCYHALCIFFLVACYLLSFYQDTGYLWVLGYLFHRKAVFQNTAVVVDMYAVVLDIDIVVEAAVVVVLVVVVVVLVLVVV